ncbi:MAG: thiamine-phosphate kinase [Pyrinomonadaceae bacterium]
MRSEFDFIQHLKQKYALNRIGDDCAVLPRDGKTDMVVTADMLVEGIDFRLDWTTPEFLGHKALAVSLSDIAAMGAGPDWAMLSIGVPPGLWGDHFLDMFYTGWHELAAEHDVELVGGDISRVPDHLVIDSIVGGAVPKGQAILRSGAHPGNAIYVTGPLGGAARGLQLLQSGESIGKAAADVIPLLLRQLRPTPKLADGERLRSDSIATAMIDISDGLSSDLAHLINASGVGARLYADSIPVEDPISGGSADALENALHGGEDFELLFTADPKKVSTANSSEFFRIGEVTANAGIIELIVDDETQILEPKGYRHF